MTIRGLVSEKSWLISIVVGEITKVADLEKAGTSSYVKVTRLKREVESI